MGAIVPNNRAYFYFLGLKTSRVPRLCEPCLNIARVGLRRSTNKTSRPIVAAVTQKVGSIVGTFAPRRYRRLGAYSHSIVAGGFVLMS